MNGSRSRWSLVAAGVVVAAALAVVVVFGVIPYPDPPALADSPDPPVTARLALLTEGRECLVVVEGDGTEQELGCGSRFEAWAVEWASADTLELDGTRGNGQRVVIDANTGDQVGVQPLPEGPAEPIPQNAQNADGDVIQTGNDDGVAWVEVITTDGWTDRIVALDGPRGYHLYDPRWSADGRWLAVRDSLDRILVVDAAGAVPVRVWAEGAGPFDIR